MASKPPVWIGFLILGLLAGCDREALILGPAPLSEQELTSVWAVPSGRLEIPGMYRVRPLILGGSKEPVTSVETENGVTTSMLTYEADVVHPASYWLDGDRLEGLTEGLELVAPESHGRLRLSGVPSLRVRFQESGEAELVYDGIEPGNLGHLAGSHHRGEHSELHAVSADASLDALEIDSARAAGGLLVRFTEFMDQDVAELMTISVIGEPGPRQPFLFIGEDGSGFVAACAMDDLGLH